MLVESFWYMLSFDLETIPIVLHRTSPINNNYIASWRGGTEHIFSEVASCCLCRFYAQDLTKITGAEVLLIKRLKTVLEYDISWREVSAEVIFYWEGGLLSRFSQKVIKNWFLVCAAFQPNFRVKLEFLFISKVPNCRCYTTRMLCSWCRHNYSVNELVFK